MGTNEHSESIIVGKDIPWGVIYGGYCRVTQFIPFAIVEAGKIKQVSQPTRVGIGQLTPYALLTVWIVVDDTYPWKTGFGFKPKSLHLPKEASMPVVHRMDFLNLWEVFRESKLITGEEVLVQYCPDIPAKPHPLLSVEEESIKLDIPRLVISIYPRGTLEKMCFPPENTLYPREDLPKPLCVRDEASEEDFKSDIFGNIWPVFKHSNRPLRYRGTEKLK